MKLSLSLFCLLAAIQFSACISVHRIRHHASVSPYQKLNKVAAGHKAVIYFRNKTKATGYNVHVATDSTYWQVSKSGKRQGALTSNISRITVMEAGKGARTGFLVCMLVGAPVGYAFGHSLSQLFDFSDTGSKSEHVEAGIRMGAIAGLGTGLFLGLPVGAATGQTIFIFPDPVQASN
ncbi:MAG: hypothetical protein ACE5IY_14050 [bacterium]